MNTTPQRRRALTATTLLALALSFAPAGANAATTKCDPKNEGQWTTLTSYGTIVTFEKSAKGRGGGTTPVDKDAYAEKVKLIVDETVTKVPYGTEILLLVVGSADATGTQEGNQRIAEARAKSVASTIRRTMTPTDIGRVHVSTTGTVANVESDAARSATVSVLRCTVIPEKRKPFVSEKITSGKNATCDPAKVKGRELFFETLDFQPAKPSYADGLKPVNAETYAQRIAAATDLAARSIRNGSPVAIEIGGWSTHTGRTSSNDQLATARARSAAEAFTAALKKTEGYDASLVRLRVVGSSVRSSTPGVRIGVIDCP